MSCGKFFFLNNKEKRCGTFVKWHFISTHAEYLHNICICMHSNMKHLECPCKLSNFSLSMCSFLSHLFTLTPLLSEISLLRCFYLCKPDNAFISLLFLFLPPFFLQSTVHIPKAILPSVFFSEYQNSAQPLHNSNTWLKLTQKCKKKYEKASWKWKNNFLSASFCIANNTNKNN